MRKGRRRRRKRRIDEVPRTRSIAVALLTLTVVGAPLLLGGAVGWAIAIIAGASGITALLAWHGCRRAEGAGGVEPAALAIALGLAVTALQLLPLPVSFMEGLAPESTAEHVRSFELLEQTASFVPFSLDPGGTREQLVQGAGILAAFCAAWLICATGGRRVVLRIVALSCFVLVATALLHEAFGLSEVFGVYRPIFARPPLLSPVLNPNHLGGLAAMGAFVLVGLAMDEQIAGRRALFLLGTAAATVVVALSLSRGAIAVTLGGSVVFALLWFRRRRTRRVPGWRTLAGAAAAMSIIALGTFPAVDAVLREFDHGDDAGKLTLIGEAAGVAAQHPWLGVGRGAGSVAFVREFGVTQRTTHAENLLVQWTTDWGLPLTLLLVYGFGLALARAALRSRTAAQLGGVVGITVLVAQNMVDFSLELAGPATVAAALFAACLAPSGGSPVSRRSGPTLLEMRHVTVTGGVLAVTATLVVGVTLQANATHTIQSELWGSLDAPPDTLDAVISRAIHLHPAEPAFPLLAGAAAVRRDDPRALLWLTRAMQLAPQWASPHEQAAFFLLNRGLRDQALLEIRETALRDPRRSRRVTCHLATLAPDADLMLRAAPAVTTGRARQEFLDIAANCLHEAPDAASRVDEALLRESPTMLAPRVRQAERLLAAGDASTAVELLEPLMGTEVSDERAVLCYGRALMQSGDSNEAVSFLRAAQRHLDNPRAATALRARAHAAGSDTEGMRRTVDELRGTSHGDVQALAAATSLEGDLEVQLGNQAQGARAYRQAYRFDPRAGYLAQAARVSEAMGDRTSALADYGTLCATTRPGSAFCANAQRLRRLAESGAFSRQLNRGDDRADGDDRTTMRGRR